MSTDYTKQFKLWRLTLVVSLPGWMRLAWVLHPLRTYRELLRMQEAERQALHQLEQEQKWEKLFCEAFKNKGNPEFEFDPKGSGRVLGLKETLAESKIPSVGCWGGGGDQGVVNRVLQGTGMKVNFDPADEETVDRRRAAVDKIREEIWEEERATRKKKKRDLR